MHAPTQKTHHTAFLLLWQKSMTNNCLTTIEAVLSTWNQRRWFICSKRYQQPQREPSIAHSMSKNSTNWEQLFTTVNSYSTWIITVWKPDKATTTPGLQAVQLTDWLFKGRPADRHWRRRNCVGGHRGRWVSLQRLVCACCFFCCCSFDFCNLVEVAGQNVIFFIWRHQNERIQREKSIFPVTTNTQQQRTSSSPQVPNHTARLNTHSIQQEPLTKRGLWIHVSLSTSSVSV